MFVLKGRKNGKDQAVQEILQAVKMEVYYFKSDPFSPSVEDEEGLLFATVTDPQTILVLK